MENKKGLYLDFLEIGSCDFNTLAETITDDQYGMVIEPLTPYLSNLPNHKNLTKVNAAVLFDLGEISVFYIKPENIEKYGLHEFMRGCNRVGQPHDLHVNYFETIEEIDKWHSFWKRPGAPVGRDLVKEGIVSEVKVPTVTIQKLIDDYNIKGIKFLKLDTEGLDPDILHSYLDTIWNDTNFRLPEKILFETNCHNSPRNVSSVIQRLVSIGYKVEVGEVNSDQWTEYDGTIFRDCRATLKYRI